MFLRVKQREKYWVQFGEIVEKDEEINRENASDKFVRFGRELINGDIHEWTPFDEM